MTDLIYTNEMETRVNASVALLRSLVLAVDANEDFCTASIMDAVKGVLKLLEDSDQFKPDAA